VSLQRRDNRPPLKGQKGKNQTNLLSPLPLLFTIKLFAHWMRYLGRQQNLLHQRVRVSAASSAKPLTTR